MKPSPLNPQQAVTDAILGIVLQAPYRQSQEGVMGSWLADWVGLGYLRNSASSQSLISTRWKYKGEALVPISNLPASQLLFDRDSLDGGDNSTICSRDDMRTQVVISTYDLTTTI
jgi:hypothetical protein